LREVAARKSLDFFTKSHPKPGPMTADALRERLLAVRVSVSYLVRFLLAWPARGRPYCQHMSACASTTDARGASSTARSALLELTEALDVGEAVPQTVLEAVRQHLTAPAVRLRPPSDEPVGGALPRDLGSDDGAVPPSPSSVVRISLHGGGVDEDLALAACQGEPRAAIAIWRRYVSQVRSKLLRWIGPHDLDDHVQEVFSRLFEQLPRLRQHSALRSFLIGITLRVACTELRRRRRWRLRLTATGELPEIAQHGHDDGTGRQALSRFEDILGKLAPRTRRVFVLRYVEKLELVDVAVAMDISLATAKRHLARASTRVFAMAEREPALADYMRDMKPRTAATAPS
jgi:RNA polymerase sigma-70 factor, ECF subfamily